MRAPSPLTARAITPRPGPGAGLQTPVPRARKGSWGRCGKSASCREKAPVPPSFPGRRLMPGSSLSGAHGSPARRSRDGGVSQELGADPENPPGCAAQPAVLGASVPQGTLPLCPTPPGPEHRPCLWSGESGQQTLPVMGRSQASTAGNSGALPPPPRPLLESPLSHAEPPSTCQKQRPWWQAS